MVQARLSRRGLLQGLLAGSVAVPRWAQARLGGQESTLGFESIPTTYDEHHHLAPGYRAQVLLRWGDPIFSEAPAFNFEALDASAQARQFGYNNDFTVYLPLGPNRGLLCVNHEYTDAHLMWPGLARKNGRDRLSYEQAAVEMAAQGMSVVEVEQRAGQWSVILTSPYNRRITATTPMRLTGPVAGHPRVKTAADPTGTLVLGTFANCAGGRTPWGTVLTCEENFDFYFEGSHPVEARNQQRMGMSGASFFSWFRYDRRFRVDETPHEPNRFGWVVEVDPLRPNDPPKKRTALGRFKHESATVALNHDGRVVIYSGDDQRYEFLYRFVSRSAYDPGRPESGRDLLDDGVLSAARFRADGTVEWLPLIHGEGPLSAKNGFLSQADVCIEARRAAELLGATRMDRPEDVEVHPDGGRIYVALSNNAQRQTSERDAANPRAANVHGHILEMFAPRHRDGWDYAARTHRWNVFLLGGDQKDRGWLSCPDNFAFDPRGRLWICTDGQDHHGQAESLYGCDVSGPGRGQLRRILNGPRGAELTGPSFTPDGRSMFLCVQHPAQEEGSTFDAPSTRWPDFGEAPPRPALLVLSREDGREIGI